MAIDTAIEHEKDRLAQSHAFCVALFVEIGIVCSGIDSRSSADMEGKF